MERRVPRFDSRSARLAMAALMTLAAASASAQSSDGRVARISNDGSPRIPQAAPAQPPPALTGPLTLGAAVQRALDNYPAIRVATESLSAAQSGVTLSRTSYLPRTDVLWQANQATRNNVFGALLPQSVVPGISGPVGFSDSTSALSSAMGVLLAWEPFDLGLRGANVETARSTERRATASIAVTRLQVATSAADAFLGVVATQQTLRAAEASVRRATVLRDVVEARVGAGLRPGVDAMRARAELALAETQRLVAQQNAASARIGLAHLVAAPQDTLVVTPGPLLQLPPGDTPPPTQTGQTANAPTPSAAQVTGNPVALEQKAAIDESGARLRALDLSWSPRFNLQATTSARGSGALTNGKVKGGFAGLKPTVANWAFGMTITFPILDRPSLQAREQVEFYRQRAETARLDRIVEDLSGQLERAQSVLAIARSIARNTPIQLDAATALEQQATARYQSGLGTILEVADAQRLLTQAEIDDTIAKLNIWRGLLQVAAAEGSLDPFLTRVQP